MKNLKFLSLGQNPQRSIPGNVLGGGQTELLKFLRKRLASDYTEPAWVQDVRDGKSAGAAAPDDYGDGSAASPESGRMGARFFAKRSSSSNMGGPAGGGGGGGGPKDTPKGPPDAADALSADPHLVAEMVKCETAIVDLEEKLKQARR